MKKKHNSFQFYILAIFLGLFAVIEYERQYKMSMVTSIIFCIIYLIFGYVLAERELLSKDNKLLKLVMMISTYDGKEIDEDKRWKFDWKGFIFHLIAFNIINFILDLIDSDISNTVLIISTLFLMIITSYISMKKKNKSSNHK